MRIIGKSFAFLAAAVLTATALSSGAYAQNGLTPYIEPKVGAVSAILMNMDTGAVIFGKNEYETRAIASVTKIMTVILTLEAGDLDKRFTVDDYAIRVEGTSMGLREGDIVTRRALCYGMMLPSGNDAANAAAVSVAGSIGKFAELMNKKAKSLGMKDSGFANPSGLDARGHYSTAYDMALLTKYALKNPLFREICSSKSVQLEYGNPPYKRWLSNNNKMLWNYDDCIGVKTGFTDAAKRCLVTAAERGGATLIAVTLNAPDDWNDHAKMLDHGFALIERCPFEYDCDGIYIDVVGGVKERVKITLADSLTVPFTEAELKLMRVETAFAPFLYAGFGKGEPAGRLTLYWEDRAVLTADLVTAEGCGIQAQKLGLFGKLFKKIRRI